MYFQTQSMSMYIMGVPLRFQSRLHSSYIYDSTVVRWSRFQSLRNEHGKPHTGGSRFNRGTVVTFPKVYATNTESPTLAVVDSTVVWWSLEMHRYEFLPIFR